MLLTLRRLSPFSVRALQHTYSTIIFRKLVIAISCHKQINFIGGAAGPKFVLRVTLPHVVAFVAANGGSTGLSCERLNIAGGFAGQLMLLIEVVCRCMYACSPPSTTHLLTITLLSFIGVFEEEEKKGSVVRKRT